MSRVIKRFITHCSELKFYVYFVKGAYLLSVGLGPSDDLLKEAT